jgi:signal transduction histidine kinase
VSREKIWRVVSNLLVNAIKFSPEGSAIEVRMQQQENSVVICIQDHGIGIPEKLKAKVFNMFTDARRTGTMGEQSFGLGLAISRQIVEAHGGEIWFESIVGQGTTFYVKLPWSAQ